MRKHKFVTRHTFIDGQKTQFSYQMNIVNYVERVYQTFLYN